jgi:hypothetical protein
MPSTGNEHGDPPVRIFAWSFAKPLQRPTHFARQFAICDKLVAICIKQNQIVNLVGRKIS